jgi:hypothetical protein
MPAATADFLGNDDADHVAIGGAAAAASGPGTRSITGADPSQLSVNVAEDLAPLAGTAAVASQATFADALAGGPHVARLGGTLLLTDPATLSTATRDALEAADGFLRTVVLYGGTAAISSGVQTTIEGTMAS